MLPENLIDWLAPGFAVIAIVLMAVLTARVWTKKPFRVALILAWCVLLVFISCGLVCIIWAEHAAKESIRKKLTDLAKSIAVGVEELGHQTITLDTPLDNPQYLSIMRTMKEWLRKVPTLATLYTMRLNENRELVFIAEPGSDLNRDGKFDPETESDEPIGNLYDEPLEDLPEFIDAFKGRSGFNGVPMDDKYGSWITAAEPLFNSEGDVEAILGVDFWAESWTAEIQASKFWPTLFYVSFLVLFFVVLFFLQSHFLNEEKLASYAVDLEKTINELVEANRQADAAIQAKGNFLTNMSHEIRTPMNAVFGFTDILSRKLMMRCLPEEREECQETVSLLLRSGNDLLTMINDILDFSQAESQLQLKNIPVPIHHLVGEVENMMHERVKEKPEIELVFKDDGNIPEWIRSDPARIRQIMVHLVGNAIKFTEKGLVSVRYGVVINELARKKSTETSTASMTLTSSATSYLTQANITLANFTTSALIAANEQKIKNAEKVFYFKVKDTGIGIAKDDMPNLFQPFSQVDSSLTRRFGGTGLGLAISRRLALLLGGNIVVSSELGKGSVFQFLLPVEECSANSNDSSETKFLMPVEREQISFSVGSQTSPAENAAPVVEVETDPEEKISVVRALKNHRILVVEDGHINQIVISSQLREAGAEVVIAENGQVALEAVAAAEEEKRPFDAILMDMQMPVMDGYEATSKLREGGYARPIIALTAHTLSGDCEKTLAAGCDAYMSKPVAFKKLLSLLTARKRH